MARAVSDSGEWCTASTAAAAPPAARTVGEIGRLWRIPSDHLPVGLALTNATLPYAVQIANKGWKKAMQENEEIRLGANVIDGKVTYQAVAEAFGMDFTPVENLI